MGDGDNGEDNETKDTIESNRTWVMGVVLCLQLQKSVKNKYASTPVLSGFR